MRTTPLPKLIQGGMGAGVSSWPLARAVSRAGQLGVVAGTALDVILARRLQIGDPGGHMRRALGHFPIPGVAKRLLSRDFIDGGKAENEPFRAMSLMDTSIPPLREELIVAANFVEVFLAKEGHDGLVGINYLEKIQLPTLPSLFGAMLAGVDFVLMGAGIPRAIPGIIDDLAAGKRVELPIDVRGAETAEGSVLHFDPRAFGGGFECSLPRPEFLAIVASVTVASVMARKASGRVDGLIIEGSSAGGHNAPPRGKMQLNADGEPVFGKRDVADLTAIAKLGLPFWVAGSCASTMALREAQAAGAEGVQVGTAFAFCAESGIDPELKQRAIAELRSGHASVRTDPLASPTGFPFKVFELEDTLSDPAIFARREKICDLGYLRHAYLREDGRVGWRCSGEPETIFARKGGDQEQIGGRKCVCNGLLANIGLGQKHRDGTREAPLLTCGSDTSVVLELLEKHETYSAADVLEHILGSPPVDAC